MRLNICGWHQTNVFSLVIPEVLSRMISRTEYMLSINDRSCSPAMVLSAPESLKESRSLLSFDIGIEPKTIYPKALVLLLIASMPLSSAAFRISYRASGSNETPGSWSCQGILATLTRFRSRCSYTSRATVDNGKLC